jgi:hypothetical protein
MGIVRILRRDPTWRPAENIHSRETRMAGKSIIRVDTGTGIFWFIGWLFTIAFAKLIWWQAILALIVWPYFLGLAVR